MTKQSTEADFKEVLESKTFVQFGEKHLGTPGARAGLTARIFSDLDPKEVLLKEITNFTGLFRFSRERLRWQRKELSLH